MCMHGGLICIAFVCLSVTGPFGHLAGNVQGHGSGQRSPGSRSKVKLVKPSLKMMILAGGLMSTSSCILFITVLKCYKTKHYMPVFIRASL